VLLFLLGVGGLSVTTLVIAVRGGRGPGDPPASHVRTDPAGFPVLPAARGVLQRRAAQPRRTRSRRASRAAAARTAAAVHTARESRTARRMSPRTGG
jgi:hypothetical protein